jgi:hypothetical protein
MYSDTDVNSQLMFSLVLLLTSMLSDAQADLTLMQRVIHQIDAINISTRKAIKQ